MARSLYVLNGPNLNLLGTREPATYGAHTLADVEALCQKTAQDYALDVVFRQTNYEGQLIEWIHEAGAGGSAGIVINPGGYTHTSVALRDAVLAVGLPVVEVHISNVFAREAFRHRSMIAPVAKASLCGFGIHGYALAIAGLAGMVGAEAAW